MHSDNMADDNDSLRFGCPKCQKRLKAPTALAGKRTRCPYCQTMLDVPLHSRTNESAEVYPLQTGKGSLLDEQPEYILVVCPVCHARMHPEANQVGRQTICPDCGTATTIERPPEAPPKKPPRSAEEVGEYPLAAEARREAKAVPAAEQDYVPVVCAICHTRMMATPDQVGSKMKCPDCGTATVVPPMPPRRPKIDVMAGSDDAYAIVGGEELQPRKPSPAPPRRVREDPPEPEPSDVPEFKEQSRRPELPAQPFLDGTFTFPFHREVWVRTLILSVWAILPVLSALKGESLKATGDATQNAVPLFGSAFLTVVTLLLVVIWFAVLSATVLAVLRETSEGVDEDLTWPGQVFLDWLGDPLHLFFAFCMSVVPGAAMAWLLSKAGIVHPLLTSIMLSSSAFLMLPIMLMSTLETGSMFGVVSWPVWRTLWTDLGTWLKFYVVAAAMVIATSVLSVVAGRLSVSIGLIAAAVIQTAAWMIYARLLGRLGWVCAEHAAFADLEREMAKMDDEDFEDVEDEELLA
jgi:DNA-directed RNA polymerase subunit RPC12/RpoP